MDLSFITRHPKLFLALSLIVAIGFGSLAPFVQPVNNVDYFRLKGHPDQKFYEEFKEIFGNDEFFVIAFEKEDIFTTDNLHLLKDITTDLEDLGLARDVVSLANVDHVIGQQDYFYIQPFLDKIPHSPSLLQKLRELALDNPLYLKNFISPDSTAAAIIVFAYDRPDDPDYRSKLIQRTSQILNSSTSGTKFYLAGSTVTNYSLSLSMQRDLAIFIPVTYLLIALVTFLFFRSVRRTALVIITVTASLGSTMGVFGMLGIPINNVTSAVPPLIMALTLASTVHILTWLQSAAGPELHCWAQGIGQALNRVAVPCVLTSLTTAAGFFSLSVSDLEPIREFALLAPAGILFGFLYSFFLLPPLIVLFGPPRLHGQVRQDQTLSWLLSSLFAFVSRHRLRIISASIAIAAMALFFAGQIKVENNLIEFFKKSSQERQAIDFVEDRLSGVSILDVSIQSQELDAFKKPENLKVVEELETNIQDISGVDTTTSFNHFIKDMNQSFHNEDPDYYTIPDSRQLISQYLLLYDSDDIDDFVHSDFDHSRIMVRLSVHSSAEKARIIKEINGIMDQLDTGGLSMRVTGQSVQEVNITDALVHGQVYSLAIALAVISVLMFLVFRSLSLGFLSLIPNCFPILLSFGLMGLLGIHLNTATSLIAAIAIGIAVDDTIHFLHHYNQMRSQGASVFRAAEDSMLVKGRALVSSSVILCIGFGVMLLSGFMPIVYFGLLSAVIMLTALAGDLVLLPAILMLRSGSKSD